MSIALPGHLDAGAFVLEATRSYRGSRGGRFDPDRWHCGRLIHAEGQTWAFTNQWGHSFPHLLGALRAAFPQAPFSVPGVLDY